MKKVLVGISGGVDSSVAAILLKEKGYEVIGVTFIFNDNFNENDSIDVCKKLGIKHYLYNYKDEFNNIVIKDFISSYKNGITPNPCVLCNKYCKFKFLYDKMLELKCDYIATGHYAKILDGKLYKSVDESKDQTYFLAQLTNEQLKRILFPLDGITKDKVREIASKYGLINANKKDSTDVCFINSKFKEYISNKIESKKGPIIDVSTLKEIGTHNGLNCYTIGQRRGLDIGGNEKRLYVVGKNVKDNILYVALGNDNDYLYSNNCIIDNVNLNIDEKIYKCNAKFRYRSNEIPVELEYLDDSIIVKYSDTKSITPGQTCVFYIDNMCIGGGTIKEVRKDDKKLWYLL